MRASNSSDGLKVNVIAGTYVVLLAFDLPPNKCKGLMGFSIHRVDHTENEAYYLSSMKSFESTNTGLPAGSQYSTKDHPIQSFQWADYSAKPGHVYTYTVTALKGAPGKLSPIAEVKVKITTESPESGGHDVYFNRGTAASQEYVRRFGDKAPNKVPNNQAFIWLSRGLYEAIESFVSSCKPGKHALRVAAYEFTYEPFLQLLKDTSDKGVDIKIVYDARKASPRDENDKLVKKHKLTKLCTRRTEGASYISHNKVIVKLENNKPIAVLMGSTNFSEPGIFGHSNVVHIIEDRAVAEKYFQYWTELHQNPKEKDARNSVEEISPLPGIPVENDETCIFSPRNSLDALNLYSQIALSAKNGLFMTFAFGMNKLFKDVYKNSKAALRFSLMEKITRPMKKGPEYDAEVKEIQDLRNMPENIFAIGNIITTNKFEGWVKEKLTGLNTNVKYIHDKFMLVDPLSKDPIVITGSANFSDASTRNNDENMVIIKGNTRVADIYLGEYMRLFSHYSFRESLPWRKKDEPPKPLRTDDWWKDYFGNNTRSIRRKYFAQVTK